MEAVNKTILIICAKTGRAIFWAPAKIKSSVPTMRQHRHIILAPPFFGLGVLLNMNFFGLSLYLHLYLYLYILSFMLTPTPSHAADKKRQSRKHSGDLAWLRLTVCTQIPGKQLNKVYY